MPFTTLTKPSLGDPTRKELIDAVIDDIAFLKTATDAVTSGGGSAAVLNGSFENDTDADLTPDAWVLTLYNAGAGSTGAIDSTISSHGSKSFKFYSPGTTGGGYLESETFIPCTSKRAYILSWQLYSSNASVRNKVDVRLYDSAQAFISTINLYDSTSNPTSWALKSGSFDTVAASTARYFKIRIIGGETGTAVAASTWFDDVSMRIQDTSARTQEVLYSSGTWTCPQGVFSVLVRAWGGGGNGFSGTGGYGGGGGEYVEKVVSVVPGTGYSYVIGSASGNTTFNTTTVIAVGGVSPLSGVGGPGGTGGTGTVKMSGETGSSFHGGASPCGGPGSFNSPGNFPGGGGGGNNAGAGGMIVLDY